MKSVFKVASATTLFLILFWKENLHSPGLHFLFFKNKWKREDHCGPQKEKDKGHNLLVHLFEKEMEEEIICNRR